jgi:thiol-disulfide isomerase/thioredoxin
MAKSQPRRKTTPPSRSISPALLLGIGGVIVIGAAALALVLGQGGGGATATPTVTPSAALPAFVQTAGDPAIGMPAPQVSGQGFDGQPVAIADDGRAKIVLFLAHWCPHCQREVPVVQDWLDAGGLPSDVDLLSVATSIDANAPNYPPDAWLEREGWTAPVLVDADNAVADLYGLTSFPYWVAVDDQGDVVLRVTGELTPEQLDALAAAAANGV